MAAEIQLILQSVCGFIGPTVCFRRALNIISNWISMVARVEWITGDKLEERQPK